MKIVIMSDLIFPSGKDSVYTEVALQDVLDKSLYDTILHSDINVVNLECVLTQSEKGIEKWGSTLGAALENVFFLKQIPNLVVNLSNNHIFDYGVQGLNETIEILDENGIKYVGVSTKGSDAYSIILEKKDNKTGIYSCSEHEFNVDSLGNGATLFDPMKAAIDICRLRSECDFVIVLYHGGAEFYPYPYPSQQRNLRHMIEAGADVVICQHNHCVSCEEVYQGGTIIYGQGTLLWGDRIEIKDNIQDLSMMNSGFLLVIDTSNAVFEKEFYKIQGNRIVAVTSDELLSGYTDRSRNVVSSEFVGEEWMKYCDGKGYYTNIFGDTFVKKSRSRIVKDALRALQGKKEGSALRIYDYLNCESHLEAMRTICRMKKDVL